MRAASSGLKPYYTYRVYTVYDYLGIRFGPRTRGVVLGIAGFILGPMLGVFLVGMFTRTRGSDRGNILAVTAGLVATIVLGDLHVTIANALAPLAGFHAVFVRPDWLPKVSFTWFATIGALVTFAVGILFTTPPGVLEEAERRAEEAGDDDRPLALRSLQG